MKLVSVVSKLLLLVFILREMSEGALSQYYFLVTVAILIARVISIGSEEQIALQKRPDKAIYFYPMVWWWGVGAALLLLISFYSKSLSWMALAGAISYSALVAGFVRIVNPGLYEVVSNAPYFLVLMLGLISGVENAQQLVLYLGIAFFSVSFVVFAVHEPRWLLYGGRKSPFRPFEDLFFPISQWFGKVLTSSLLVLNLRYTILVFLLLHSAPNDTLALSLAVGEVVWQLGMVFVNRRFSALVGSRRPILWNNDVRSLIFPFLVYCIAAVAFSILGVTIVKGLNWIPYTSINNAYLLGGIVFGCSICLLSYLRVLYMVSGLDSVSQKKFNFVLLQLTMITLGASVALLLPESIFWMSLYLGAAVNVICVALWAKVFKNSSNRPVELT
ncbi:hypothetical protein [Stutzerimonas stutzeri]|uniref:hypothetical protein n=1 Tax=Stutzerimonas stutzeri TaxID=316 RepID=UPI0012DA46FD|nr:hypothetical protein [Stutzerimonas stutzeri]